MTLKEIDDFTVSFINENNLKDSNKNRNLIKMILKSSMVQGLKNNYEISEYLKKKFMS